jgi:ribonuclease-3
MSTLEPDRFSLAPDRQKDLTSLLARLGIEIERKDDHRKNQDLKTADRLPINWQLLDRALIHPTFSSDYNYEKLEFFGDSVLRLAVAVFLRQNYADYALGDLAALRSHLVSDEALAEIADSYGLDRFLVMSSSLRDDPKSRRSRLADATEAILAALYLSTNDLSLISPWLDLHLQRIAQKLLQKPSMGNYKAALQELTQAHWKMLPEYRSITARSSPTNDDSKTSALEKRSQQKKAKNLFAVEVWFQDKCWGYGEGRSIKAAQQVAAEQAYGALLPTINTTNSDSESIPTSP